MNKRHYEHTLPNIRGSLSNTYRLSYLQIVRFLNHAANKQVYFGTCITSPASGGTLRRLAVIDRVKHLSDTALRA